MLKCDFKSQVLLVGTESSKFFLQSLNMFFVAGENYCKTGAHTRNSKPFFPNAEVVEIPKRERERERERDKQRGFSEDE